jgi:SAM-dependent methyltransferase
MSVTKKGLIFDNPAEAKRFFKPRVLDACCGSRMFWFDHDEVRAVFMDKRREIHRLADKSSKGGSRLLVVDPDLISDFTALPFRDEAFPLVVFDPPHLVRNGVSGWLAKKYGKLGRDWREDIRLGFAECFRVLQPLGTLIFKWNENDIPVSQILALTPHQPLIGNKCGRTAKSHWLVFQKSAEAAPDPEASAGPQGAA